jgi:S-DNA-T family DNA segregation ATPase FtsK/SpoIIIE
MKLASTGRGKTGSRNSAKGKNTKRKTTQARTSSSTKRKPDKRTIAKKKRFITNEVEIIAFSFFALFLLLGNFGLTGRAGEFASSVQMGLMGLIGYVFPFILAAVVYIYAKNKNAFLAKAKLIISFIIVFILSALMQLLFGSDYGADILRYYAAGAAREPGGGAVGGIIAYGLTGVAGTIGAYLILVVLLIIGMVFVTERSFVNAVKNGSERTVIRAKENHERFKENMELRREERLRRREEEAYSLQENIFDDYAEEEEFVKPVYAGFGDDIIGDYTEEEYMEEDYPEEDEYNSYSSEFHGNIELPDDYDYDEDSVPFDETDEDRYKIYRNGRNALLQRDEDRELDLKDAFEAGYAVSRGYEEPESLREEVSDIPAKDPEVDYRDIMSFRQEPEPVPDIGEEAEHVTATVTTSTGKEVEYTDIEDKDDIIRKKLGSDKPERAEKTTEEDNTAVAKEIKEKEIIKKPYVFPPVSLLKRGQGRSSFDQKELKDTAIKLQQTLKTFGVGVTVTNVACGPSVTRYELTLEQGVKVSKITSLADDIKYALAAEEIRIEAPIPGKSAVGIEVPNKDNSIVHFRDIIDNDEFRGFKSKLAFAVGKDIGGQNVITDLAKMPHVLIAGATGSGKSVCINTLIMSLIYKASPDDVRMIMVDPKVVELSVYNGIPHLLIPVVTDPKKAAAALNWAVAEMTERYKKFAETGTRDLKGYNARVEAVSSSDDIPEEEKPEKLPQIVIIIDELADLMMVASSEVEAAIIRLAQLARAAGIHLVIATQRPSVNVITGLIKANVPSRIAFKVSSGVDSRTILDMNGAEKLLGYGDMLFFPSGAPKPSRIQGSFISDAEVQAVVDFLKKDGEAGYSNEIESRINSAEPSADGGAGGASADRDEYFEQAGRLIIEKDKASIGMLQRMYKIGFNRAARIMDQLAEAGVVGPEEGTKPRKVLMTEEEFSSIL